ncbi:hypothetical protein [Thiocystis minor]|uniref:hypothetical protein n=1 Tax=Thiocystis minor TaxID=61597 RepID=UPI0019121A1B|nr:hypothetical protein [Thiocystis minor]
MRHLERIEYCQQTPTQPTFTVVLDAGDRLAHDQPAGKTGETQGRVTVSPDRALTFTGFQQQRTDSEFGQLKEHRIWPRSFYRDESCHERPTEDKARPEAAVLFARATDDSRFSLRWAVFLPLYKGEEQSRIDGGWHYRITLHGQFFVDSGRRGVHGFDSLHKTPPPIDAELDDATLRLAWNAHLAQQVLAPLVLPALARFVQAEPLDDAACRHLTAALQATQFFQRFQKFLCKNEAWCRILRPDGPAWELVSGADRAHLRPFPAPSKADPQWPWQVFPRLSGHRWLLFDQAAPALLDQTRQWLAPELEQLLAEVPGIFSDGPRMEYLAEFLESSARPFLNMESLQRRLVELLRAGFIAADASVRTTPELADKVRRLIALLEPRHRLDLTTELPETTWHALWFIGAPILLVPKLVSKKGSARSLDSGVAVPTDDTLREWLSVIDQHLSDFPDQTQDKLLGASKILLKTLDPSRRGQFFQKNLTLRVIAMRDARTKRTRPASPVEIFKIHDAGCLFGLLMDSATAQLGLTPLLAAVLPEHSIGLVDAETYKELFPGKPVPAKANDAQACLMAIARDQTGRLGGIPERRALLEKASDPGTDTSARRGLRYLLHGNASHRHDDQATLWIPGQKQHPAWPKLWRDLHGEDQWNVLDRDLVGCLPSSRWPHLGIEEIEADNLIRKLQPSNQGIRNIAAFDPEDCEEILSKIHDQDLWQRLPLHTTVGDNSKPVSVCSKRVYLAPKDFDPSDPLIREATLIRRSDHPSVADKQRKWLRPLDDRARLDLALGTTEPSRHWRTIMDALANLQSGTNSDPDLLDRLRERPWLPTRHGWPVKPQDVIELAGGLDDEVRRLVTEHRQATKESCFATSADLDRSLADHPAWDWLRENTFSTGEAGLDRLARLLKDVPDYRIGNWSAQPKPDALTLLARCDLLPGWRLLQQAARDPFDLATAWRHLHDGLAQPLAPECLLKVLKWITAETTDWEARKTVCDAYLRQLTQTPDGFGAHLADLRFASRAREWRSPAELCAGAPGIDANWLLDDRQSQILDGVIHRADRRPAKTANDASIPVASAGFVQARQAALENLRNYFQRWEGGLVPTSMIGVILALLGPNVRALAENYLDRRSFDPWLLAQLPDPRGEAMRGSTETKKYVKGLIDRIEPAIGMTQGDRIDAPNLLGRPISVPLEQDFQTLLAGLRWEGANGAFLTLRQIEPNKYPQDRLSRLLQATAEELYSRFCNQPNIDFSGLWKELDRSDQLEIGAAKNLIRESLPFYLRQLSLDDSSLKKKLNQWDTQRSRVEEAKDSGLDVAKQKALLEQSLAELADCLVQNAGIQQSVLAGVKDKLNRLAYDTSSIPFEIFQNADDAAVELGQMEAHTLKGCDIPAGSRRMVVEADPHSIRFLHWGRLINARGPVGFDGEERGYGRDLEKMLILSVSDKQANQAVTGEHGLGFKSVLLACNRPRILSGGLAVEVVAGLLPEPWTETEAARDCLSRYAEGASQRGTTLIELPSVSPDPRILLERFTPLAGLLCVFGRAIRTIAIHQAPVTATGQSTKALQTAVDPQRFCWEPKTICSKVECGRLDLKVERGAETRALCVRTDSGALLIALEPNGFRRLPSEVPSIWVTAPTREKGALGFAVNGRFDLNVGRVQLTSKDENLTLARQIGSEAGEALGELFQRSRDDWSEVRQSLGVTADVSLHDFWHGIWVGLTKGCGRRSPAETEADAVTIGREVAFALLKRLCDCPQAVPNGLTDPFQSLISVQDARYELADILSPSKVIDVLAGWGRFTAKYPATALVAPDIGAILNEIKVPRLSPLSLSGLIGLLDQQQVQPEDARVLGQILRLSKENAAWKQDDVKERIKELQFLTQADRWTKAEILLVDHGKTADHPEESLRHRIAPLNHRLHADYSASTDDQTPALDFFRYCREHMKAQAETLEKWILAAKDDAERLAALVYLANGELGEKVAERVRGKDWLQNMNPALMAQLTSEQRDRLQRRLISQTQIASVWYGSTDDEIESTPHIDLGDALKAIHRWWQEERTHLAPDYRKRLYPDGALNLAKDPETGRYDRSSWLILFALGSFQSMGKTREEHHREFIRLCQNSTSDGKSWWEIFSDLDPKQHPERWMDVIESYAENQIQDEKWTQWIAQFPKLYKFRRWMDDYVELFLSIERFKEPFALDSLLTPKANSHFGGGGIEPSALNRTLRVGGPLVIRELLHYGIIKNPMAIPHAYAPIERIQRFLGQFDGVQIDTSKDIHDCLIKNLDEGQETFNGDYDIPLRIVAADEGLQWQLFQGQVT